MKSRTRGWRLATLLVPVRVLLSACSDRNAVNKVHNKSGGGSGGYGYKIAVVTHGGAGDSFWSIVKKGVQQAGKDMGDSVSYQSDGDPTKQSQLIDAAVNAKPDGLVVSRSEEHTSELQSRPHLVCRLLLEKKKRTQNNIYRHQKKKKTLHNY